MVVQNQEFAEMKQREADEEQKKRRSSQNIRMLIDKAKKKAKPRKVKKGKGQK